MISLKDDSIQIAHLSPGLLLALIVADQVYQEYGYECVVTSANDAEHAHTSLHYANDAIDLRTVHMATDDRSSIRDEIRNRLNTDFDVVLEENHLHIEVQPKRR